MLRNLCWNLKVLIHYVGMLTHVAMLPGQHAVLKGTSVGDTIQHMWDQEKHHLDTFNKLIPKHR